MENIKTTLSKEDSIDMINLLVRDQLEYECNHEDSGDNYSHLVSESWNNSKTVDLMDSLEVCGTNINSRWVDIDLDSLVEIALDSFTMKSGHIYTPCSVRWSLVALEGIIIGAFPVGEVGVCLNDIVESHDIDLYSIKYECESYISNRYAYESTDAVWYAVINTEAFNDNIQLHFDRESLKS